MTILDKLRAETMFILGEHRLLGENNVPSNHPLPHDGKRHLLTIELTKIHGN